ncbi:MAG: DUF1292 domain-containing protein [Clostridia bacterium]|nr:DUF1292 domain-containing protein [Clostridia bacterium]
MNEEKMNTNEEEMPEFGNDLITLTDEETGEELQFEVLATMTDEETGRDFIALIPVFQSPEDALMDDGTFTVLEVGEDNEFFTIDDEEELDRIGLIFEEKLRDYYEEEEEEN